MFSRYKPRLLLLTTPSYSFNARFYPPGAELSSQIYISSHFLDPTGRTDRYFRHHDHKFEWTREEFAAWCHQVASTYGYTVHVEGVGRPMEPDPWNRDEELGCASQVAVFRRSSFNVDIATNEDEMEEMEVLQDLLTELSDKPHSLFVEHHYAAHPSSGKYSSLQEIGSAVKELMLEYAQRGDYSWTIYQLWVENRIGEICGGQIDKLLEALFQSRDLLVEYDRTHSVNTWSGWLEWTVRLRNPVIPDNQMNDLQDILGGMSLELEPPAQRSEGPIVWDHDTGNDQDSDKWWDSVVQPQDSGMDWGARERWSTT